MNSDGSIHVLNCLTRLLTTKKDILEFEHSDTWEESKGYEILALTDMNSSSFRRADIRYMSLDRMLSDIQAEIEEVQERVAASSATASRSGTAVQTLTTRIESIEQGVKTSLAAASRSEAVLRAIATRIENDNKEVDRTATSSLTAALRSESAIQALATRIKTIEQGVTASSATASRSETAIETLATRIETIERSVAALSSANLQSNMHRMMDRLASLETTLETTLASAALPHLQTDITSAVAELSRMREHLVASTTRLSQLEAQTARFATQLDQRLPEPPRPECAPTRVRRLPIDDDYPICREPFLLRELHELVWCKSGCGRTVHKMCFEQWEAGCVSRHRTVTCTICRTTWAPECECR